MYSCTNSVFLNCVSCFLCMFIFLFCLRLFFLYFSLFFFFFLFFIFTLPVSIHFLPRPPTNVYVSTSFVAPTVCPLPRGLDQSQGILTLAPSRPSTALGTNLSSASR